MTRGVSLKVVLVLGGGRLMKYSSWLEKIKKDVVRRGLEINKCDVGWRWARYTVRGNAVTFQMRGGIQARKSVACRTLHCVGVSCVNSARSKQGSRARVLGRCRAAI